MILGLVEHDRGRLNPLSLEMLTMGRVLADELGDSLDAVLIGGDAAGIAAEIEPYGVSSIHLVKHKDLGEYAPVAWARSVSQLIDSIDPQVVLAAGTDRGNEVMAHVGAMTGAAMAANCTEIHPGEPYVVTRLRWGGSLLEEAALEGSTKLVTTAPHAVAAEPSGAAGSATIVEVTPNLDVKDLRVRITSRTESAAGGMTLTEAPVVVGGGRGVGSADGFRELEELARLLGGVVGGSRVVTSLGWRPHSDQIGQTGTRIAPELYIACGISGAIQHMVGCKSAKRILAINTDRDSPIMARADYAVIGDLRAIVPAVIAEIRKAQ